MHLRRQVLLALVFLAPFAAARGGADVDSSLREVKDRYKTAATGHGDDSLDRLHQRAVQVFRVTGALVESCQRSWERGDDAGRESGLLVQQAGQLDMVRREVEEALARMEGTLAAAGLEVHASRVREFRAFCRARIGALRAGLDSALNDARNGNRRSAGRRLRELRGAIARAVGEPAPRTFAIRAAEDTVPAWPMPKRQVSTTTAPRAITPSKPEPADLAESDVVKLTPEIRAKAAELGGSPTALLEFVRASYDFEPYPGLLQNSQAVFFSRRGNDYDLASLLIAMLRASGVPARYGIGRVAAPARDIANWVGVDDRMSAMGIMQRLSPVEIVGDSFRFNHVWVVAWTGEPGAQQWVALDPSYRPRPCRGGLRIPRLPFDRMQFLATLKPVLSSEVYLDQIRQYVRENYPGKALSDLLDQREPLVIGQDRAQEPSYEPAGDAFYWAEAPAEMHHRVVVSLSEAESGVPAVTSEFSVPASSLEGITVAFGPATAGDTKAAALFGGLERAPRFVVYLVPQIWLGDKVVASGKQIVSQNQYVFLSVVSRYPKNMGAELSYSHRVHVGETVAVGLGAHQISDWLLTRKVAQLLGRIAGPGANPETTVRDLTQLAALRYLSRVPAEKRRVAAPLHLRLVQPRAEEAALISTLDVKTLFDRPFLATPGRLVVDAPGLSFTLHDAHAPETNTPEIKNFRQMMGLTLSGLEHELWEELVLVPSVSTTRALQVARESQIRIQVIDAANLSAELQALQLPDSYKVTMTRSIASGMTIVTPQRLVTFGKWQGVGWIAETADGSGAYYISEYRGGDTGGNQADPRPVAGEPGLSGDPLMFGGTACGQPVTISNGNMFHQFTDLALSSRGFPVVLRRTYNSQSTYNGVFGYGWTHNYNLSLRQTPEGLVFFNESGGSVLFPRSGDTWNPPAWMDSTLARDGDGYTLAHRDGRQWRFDTGGRLIRVSDRNGNAHQLSWESYGLRLLTDALGRQIQFFYDTQGRITAIQDFTGRRLAYRYNDAGDLIESSDFDGYKTVYAYYTDASNNHNLKSFTRPEGNGYSFEYYGNDKVFRILGPGGGAMQFFYLPMRSQTILIDERGYSTTFFYNGAGNVTRVIYPDGNVVDQTWNDRGRVLTRTDQIGNTTQFSYDVRGNLAWTRDALGNSTFFTYEGSSSRPATVKNPRGNTVGFQYDARGNVTRVTDPKGGETSFVYDRYGNLTSLTNTEGNLASVTYDAFDNPVETRDGAGNALKRTFDVLRRVTAVTGSSGNSRRFEYDNSGRVTRVIDELNNETRFAYDHNGRLVRRTDANGYATRYAWDGLDNLVQVVDALGNVTRYGYASPECACSVASTLTSVTDPKGNVRTYAYDFRNRMTGARDPLGNQWTFTYDARGNLVERTDAAGAKIRFEYDALGRLLRRILPDGRQDTFAYDAAGNLISASNAWSTLAFTFDEAERLVSVLDSRTANPIQYVYNRAGQRVRMTDSDGGITSYVYDKAGRLTTISPPRSSDIGISYDPQGRRAEMRYPNGVRATYRYDAAGRLEELVYLAPGGSGQLASFRYRYDAGGRRVEATDPAGSHTYEYDEVNRLVGTQHPDGGEKYAYDAAGNRIQSSFDGTSNVDSANRLLSNGEAAFLYDENGRMVGRSDSRGASTYEYDAKGQMVRADLPDGRAVAYHYDPFGRRVEKYVDGVSTRYLYDGGHILAELDAQGRIAARYTFGPGVDEALLAEIGGEFASYHADGRGNIALATGAVGVPVGTAAYAAFGQLLGPPSLPGPFAFAGREFDRETELYYYRARSYEPRTGRFLQPDPLWDPTQPGSSNLYPYVGNNPVNLVDPDGQIWWLLPVLGKAVLAGTVNAAISGGYTWITQADNPNRAWNTAIDSGIGFLQGFGMGLIGADAPWLAALVGAAGNVASQALTNQPGSGFDLISVGVSASAGALGQSLSNMLPKWSSKTLTTVVGEGIGGILEVLEQEALRGARSFVDGVAEILRSLERLPEAMMQDPFMCY